MFEQRGEQKRFQYGSAAKSLRQEGRAHFFIRVTTIVYRRERVKSRVDLTDG